ncbi:MAG: hypothetical protein Q9M35_11345 [Rhodothermus sp.]|nr:hypothetical protein [Rhodothermus sp.]
MKTKMRGYDTEPNMTIYSQSLAVRLIHSTVAPESYSFGHDADLGGQRVLSPERL